MGLLLVDVGTGRLLDETSRPLVVCDYCAYELLCANQHGVCAIWGFWHYLSTRYNLLRCVSQTVLCETGAVMECPMTCGSSLAAKRNLHPPDPYLSR